MNELYKKLRPKTIKALVGNEPVKVQLRKYEAAPETVPHSILFTGPSGTGKTTVARILADVFKPHQNHLREYNCADFRGIDMVRDLIKIAGHAPPFVSEADLAKGHQPVRVFIIDECHQLTRDAQEALLKILEDTPPWVYFMLATTNPSKLIPAIKTRMSELKLAPLSIAVTEKYLNSVCKNVLKKEIDEEVISAIAANCEGSLRKALVLLEQVKDLDSEKGLEVANQAESSVESIALARALLKKGAGWNEVAKIVKSLDEDPESIRRMVLGYMSSVALGGGPIAKRAIFVCECFRDNYYDTGKAGLVMSCYEVIVGES